MQSLDLLVQGQFQCLHFHLAHVETTNQLYRLQTELFICDKYENLYKYTYSINSDVFTGLESDLYEALNKSVVVLCLLLAIFLKLDENLCSKHTYSRSFFYSVTSLKQVNREFVVRKRIYRCCNVHPSPQVFLGYRRYKSLASSTTGPIGIIIYCCHVVAPVNQLIPLLVI